MKFQNYFLCFVLSTGSSDSSSQLLSFFKFQIFDNYVSNEIKLKKSRVVIKRRTTYFVFYFVSLFKNEIFEEFLLLYRFSVIKKLSRTSKYLNYTSRGINTKELLTSHLLKECLREITINLKHLVYTKRHIGRLQSFR